MPKVPIPLGKMNLDKGPSPGDHLWVAKSCFYTQNGYESLPLRKQLGSTFGPGQAPQGAHCWNGAGSQRIYAGFTSTIYEINPSSGSATDVTGNSLTNDTNGLSFASFGEYCFASNGVDEIQQIRVPSSLGSSTNFGDMTYTSTGAQIAPKYICSHKNHIIGANVKMLASYEEIDTLTTAVGAAFTNQPSGDSVEVISSSAADTTQTITILGTRVGQGDTVFVDTKVLTGTTFGTFPTYNNWDKILAVFKSAATVGTVTVREASGDLTITTLAPATLDSGVQNFTFSGGDGLLDIVADGATTKQIGLMGFNVTGTTIFDSQALSGTTTVQSNERFAGSAINILTGDLESTRTVTVTSHAFPNTSEHPYSLWVSGTDDPEGYGSPLTSPTIIGCERLQLFDGEGVISGVIDGGDAFFVFKTNAVYRVDGPPFIPTVISYSLGMPVGCTPYRQDTRIYFWSSRGLFYIDTTTNETVDVFGDRMSRSVTDWANANFGFTIGTFPFITATGTTLSSLDMSVANTGGTARVSGDSKYGWVLVTFANAAYNYNGIVYQSREDTFFIPDAKWNSNSFPVEAITQAGNAPYPGSALRLIEDGGASNNIQYWAIGGAADTDRSDDEDMFVMLPFIEKGPSESAIRLKRIRPRIANMYSGSDFPLDNNASSGCFALTKYTGGQNWTTATGVMSGGWSQDGWIEFPDASWGLAFAVGITPASSISASVSQSLPGEFSVIEIEYESAPSKTE